MADNKEIRISAKLDTNQFDTQLKSLEEKMKSLQKSNTQKLGTLGNLKDDPVFGPSAKKAYDDQQKSTTTYFQNLFKGQQEAFKNGEKYINQLKEQIRLEKEKGNLDKDKVKNLNDFLSKAEQGQRKTMTYASTFKSRIPEEMQAESYRPSPNFKQGPPDPRGRLNPITGAWEKAPEESTAGGTESQFAGLTSILKSAGAAAILKGAINATVKFIEHRVNRDTEMLSNKASAAIVATNVLHESLAGKGGSAAYWGQERVDAMSMAQERQEGIKSMDAIKGMGTVGAAAITGGLIGSALGGPFAPITGPAGAIIAGVGTMVGNKRNYNLAFDSEAYNAMSSKEAMQNYQANLLAKKARNPWKTLGEEKYYSDYDQQILTGRSLGIDTKGMLGTPGIAAIAERKARQSTTAGYHSTDEWHEANPYIPGVKGSPGTAATEGYAQQGLREFSPTTMARQAVGLQGSSTAMMLGGRVKSATMERQFNLQNAASLFGAQGQLGLNEDKSEQNIKKILSDAMQTGMDKSKIASMPQELQKFTQTVMEMATSTGGFSTKISQQMAAALGAETPTMAGINAGKTAVEDFNEKAKSDVGMEGQIGYSTIHKMLPNLRNPDVMKALNRTNASEFSAMSAFDKEVLARQAETDIPTLTKVFAETDAQKQSMTSSQDTANKELADFKSNYPDIEKNLDKYPKNIQDEYYQLLGSARVKEKSRGGQNAPWNVSNANVNLKGASLSGKFSGETNIDSNIQDMMTRITDPNALAKESAAGKGELAALNNERNQMTSLTTASKSFTENTAVFLSSYDNFSKAVLAGATGLDSLADSLKKVVLALNANGSLPSTGKIPQPSTTFATGTPGVAPYSGPVVK